ncbi:UNVERIFIED_CONTAM: hypothetical protein Slati_3109100 [Sesamum latifolium]|uniref:Reverse transcriptase domain-containing protein n=1 Tax=Sesamum latifolium TaxID=2727402 RepID=A0AAW2UVN1_9LAMI
MHCGLFSSSRTLPDDIRSSTEHLPIVILRDGRGLTASLHGDGERLITDNVLLAFETNHFLHTHSKGRNHFMNLKLDINKAYDRVEWSFLRSVLEAPSSLFQVVAEGSSPGGGRQEINLHKSSAVFSRNTPWELQQQLADILGICLENKHALYLGLPVMAFRSKALSLQPSKTVYGEES